MRAWKEIKQKLKKRSFSMKTVFKNSYFEFLTLIWDWYEFIFLIYIVLI